MGRPRGSSTPAAPAAAPPARPPAGPGARRATALRVSVSARARPPAGDGEAAAARAAGQACVLRCALEAAFPGRAVNLCGSSGRRSLRAFFFFRFQEKEWVRGRTAEGG